MTCVNFYFHLPYVKLSSYLKHERIKMETIYRNLPEPDDFIDGPSDEELKKIEEELEKYSN